MKRKIYLASSWRNELQQSAVSLLRDAGHLVYDFKNPRAYNTGFKWSEIDPNWKNWKTYEYLNALQHNIAIKGYFYDWEAMQWADTGVLLLPSGRSAHIEAGYFKGAGKSLYIVLPEDKTEPELMYKMADVIVTSVKDLIKLL